MVLFSLLNQVLMLEMFPKSVRMISYWHKLQCLLNTFINLLFMLLKFPTKKNNYKKYFSV